MRDLGIRLVNLTLGSPYYNPHLQRPAAHPPSEGLPCGCYPLDGHYKQRPDVQKLRDIKGTLG